MGHKIHDSIHIHDKLAKYTALEKCCYTDSISLLIISTIR